MPRHRLTIVTAVVGISFLATPYRVVASSVPTLEIYSATATEDVTVTFNDPYNSTSHHTIDAVTGQFLAYYNPNGERSIGTDSVPIYTFCVDLLDDIGVPSGFYNVTLQATSGNVNTSNNLANLNPGNGDKIAYLYNTYGSTAISPSGTYAGFSGAAYAAGLQLAIWNLLDPGLTFTADSGDPNVLAAYNYFNGVTNPGTVGQWLQSQYDPVYGGTGQGFLYPGGGSPDFSSPEPGSLAVVCSGAVCLVGFGLRRRRIALVNAA